VVQTFVRLIGNGYGGRGSSSLPRLLATGRTEVVTGARLQSHDRGFAFLGRHVVDQGSEGDCAGSLPCRDQCLSRITTQGVVPSQGSSSAHCVADNSILRYWCARCDGEGRALSLSDRGWRGR